MEPPLGGTGSPLLTVVVVVLGILQLFSVAGGSWSPWAEPQLQRFGMGLAVMFVVGTMNMIWIAVLTAFMLYEKLGAGWHRAR